MSDVPTTDNAEFAPVPVGDFALPRFSLPDLTLLLARMKDRELKNVDAELKARGVSPVEYAQAMASVRNEHYSPGQAHQYAFSLDGSIEILGIALGKIQKTTADLPPMPFDELTMLAVRVLHVVADPTIRLSKTATSPTSSTSPLSGPPSTSGTLAGSS